MREWGLARIAALLCSFSVGVAGRAQAHVFQDVGSPPVPELDVPYLPQTGVLCGGAALAMVLRHLGERRATVDEFLPLVDPKAGGIAGSTLVAEAERRGWQTNRPEPTLAGLAGTLAGGQPPILLIEDRRDFYHYVVLVGLNEDSVVVHDPVWGPRRRVPLARFVRQWNASGRWALVVLPDGARRDAAAPAPSSDTAGVPVDDSPCARQLGEAIDMLQMRGTADADARLEELRRRCPNDSRPVSELAAVRFSERRWDEASRLATEAVAIDPLDAYARDVLASSRFLQGDRAAALDAWNAVGRPRIDLVNIDGLARTRYALVAEMARLRPGALLTNETLGLAMRRVRQIPMVGTAAVEYRPQPDGYVSVDATVLEKPSPWTAKPSAWAGPALSAATDREISVDMPAPGGLGGLWSARWRWWDERPGVGVSFAAPRTGWWPGVWRIELSNDAQTYSSRSGPVRESRTRGTLSVSQWITSSTWYEAMSGMDVWDGDRRTASIGGRMEQRFAGDRLAVGGGVELWLPLRNGESFATSALHLTSRVPVGGAIEVAMKTGIDFATSHAPLALWSGADTGAARPRLLRAHPLLDEGIVAGPAFGRLLRYATVEAARPLPGIVRAFVDVAGFVDVVSAGQRRVEAGRATHVDYGAGLRIRIPSRDARLRIDYGRGVFDGAHALSIGWVR